MFGILATPNVLVNFLFFSIFMFSETNPPGSSQHLTLLAIVALALLIVGASVFFYLKQKAAAPAVPPPANTVLTTSAPASVGVTESLGGTLYEKANNPLGDKLPGQIPVTNPIGDAYKNPF